MKILSENSPLSLQKNESEKMKSLEVLLELNRRGLVPGPEESEVAFFARCKHALPASSPPFSSLSEQLFDVVPDWIEICYKKKGLRFWEGGCTWIEGNLITLQLHPALLKKKKHWGYEHKEIISHEFVHAVRGAFEEPIFEEILAYHTSSSPIRRFWGPLLRTSNESLGAVLTLLACMIASFFEPLGWIAWGSTIGLLGLATVRLVKAQRIFKRTLGNLARQVGKKRAMAVMLRLTDREVIRFSKMGTAEIAAYSVKMAKTQIRWQQIRAAYF